MKKPIGKIDKYLETQRMYNSIKEQIIECYELEQRSEYLDALRIIDCGLGSYALSNLKVQSSILGKINLLRHCLTSHFADRCRPAVGSPAATLCLLLFAFHK